MKQISVFVSLVIYQTFFHFRVGFFTNLKLSFSLQRGPQTSTIKPSQAGWWKQLRTLTQRSFINMSRDIGYYWLRVIIYSIVSICVGTIFYDVGTGYTAILARGACGGFITGFMVFMSIGSFPSFIEDMKVNSKVSPF